MTQHAAAGAEIVGTVEGLQAHRRPGSAIPTSASTAPATPRPRGPGVPDASRILLVADAYDAMTSDRAYRRARPASEAVDELRRDAGSQFDPECVELLVRELADRGVLAVPGPATLPA